LRALLAEDNRVNPVLAVRMLEKQVMRSRLRRPAGKLSTLEIETTIWMRLFGDDIRIP